MGGGLQSFIQLRPASGLTCARESKSCPRQGGFLFFFNRFFCFLYIFFLFIFLQFFAFFSHDNKKLQHIIPQKKDEEE